ncbi:YajQ family cyclic di-GMP-binding protein [Thiohalomonas denitrificans]|uniref:YajQ family cyclic di-GMP-binding protein n=1 Tax=Thiohalomonas denitrificans TaxID=415747 RepID=UPI0026F23BD7|nr:YajQ family cyclic di-GMP-binding protein [Thiohalomonas denitrificans]
MPSFDVVSEIDGHELTNAVDQVNREVANRFDFKGSDARVEQSEGGLTLEAQSDFQIRQILEILYQKMSKRGLDVGFVKEGDVEERGMRAYMEVKLSEGIDKELAKQIVKRIKEAKLKVQAAIQGEQVRITGKKRDDLQAAMAMLRQADLGQPLQFTNFRD